MGERASAVDLQNAFTRYMPHLAPFWSKPVSALARHVYDVDPTAVQGPIRLDALLRLQTRLKHIALRTGYSEQQAMQVVEQLARAPVVQTGPHCHLLVAPDAFYTHLFSIMGLEAKHLQWHVWYGASTVKLIEGSKKGPGWLHLDGMATNVFGLSRKNMDAYSACSANGPYRFALSGEERCRPANAAADRLLAMLPDRAFPSPAQAIRCANLALWEHAFPSSVNLLQLDDEDVADLVADHLEDDASWLSLMLFKRRDFVDALLRALNQMATGQWKGWISRTTDFFWELSEQRIAPLRLNDGILMSSHRPMLRWEFQRETIANGLRQRRLLPNLFMTFLVLSILPGVRVLGGRRQVIYYPLMRYVIRSAVGESRELHLSKALDADTLPGCWGHRVLGPPSGDPFLQMEEPGVRKLIDLYSEVTLHDAFGQTNSFTEDNLWRELALRTAREAAVPQPTGWQGVKSS